MLSSESREKLTEKLDCKAHDSRKQSHVPLNSTQKTRSVKINELSCHLLRWEKARKAAMLVSYPTYFRTGNSRRLQGKLQRY